MMHLRPTWSREVEHGLAGKPFQACIMAGEPQLGVWSSMASNIPPKCSPARASIGFCLMPSTHPMTFKASWASCRRRWSTPPVRWCECHSMKLIPTRCARSWRWRRSAFAASKDRPRTGRSVSDALTDIGQTSPSVLVLRSAEFLGEPDEKPFRPADVAEPIRVLILHHFADELRAALAEPFKCLVDVFHGEHDAEVT
jgi:hypothetical protein